MGRHLPALESLARIGEIQGTLHSPERAEAIEEALDASAWVRRLAREGVHGVAHDGEEMLVVTDRGRYSLRPEAHKAFLLAGIWDACPEGSSVKAGVSRGYRLLDNPRIRFADDIGEAASIARKDHPAFVFDVEGTCRDLVLGGEIDKTENDRESALRERKFQDITQAVRGLREPEPGRPYRRPQRKARPAGRHTATEGPPNAPNPCPTR